MCCKIYRSRSAWAGLFSLFSLLFCPFAAQGALLGLPQSSPDIRSEGLSVDYATGTQKLTVQGFPADIDFNNVAPPDHNILGALASIHLGILVNSSGTLLGGIAGDDLSIKGAIDFNNSNTINGGEVFATLLTGEIVAFGYQNTGAKQLFEFKFNVTGGTQAAAFGPQVGMIMDIGPGSTFTGVFTANFNNFGNPVGGTSDTFHLVPEPSTWLTALLGAVCLVFSGGTFRRRPAQVASHT